MNVYTIRCSEVGVRYVEAASVEEATQKWRATMAGERADDEPEFEPTEIVLRSDEEVIR